MLPDVIAWSVGEVIFWDLVFLDLARPLSEQVDNLKEDLAQVRFPRGLLIDVGWYPECSRDGAFVVRVVRDADWDNPLFLERHSKVEGLLRSLQRAVVIADANA